MRFEHALVTMDYIAAAIAGARLSYGSGGRSDSRVNEAGVFAIGPEDKKLVQKLVRAGGGEEKFLRTIPVSVFITAPSYWWREMDTYKIGTVAQSSSLMHRVRSRGAFCAEDFSVDDPDDILFQRALSDLNQAVCDWLVSGEPRNSTSHLWRRWQQLVPFSFNYTRHWVASYAALRNIYRQRRHHRLREWREWCAWVETLPYADMLVIGDAQ